EGIPAAADIVNLRYKSCPEMEGQDQSTSQINKAVFFTSALLIFLLVAFAAVFPDVADKNFKLLQQQIFTNASWFY
ncbi:hypothetical protein, partial [Enterobacter asburiae]|uniref:hypothetical protein n=1 Tax=Enterobacter asburiae TaxID=61645 RepID=UPI003BCB7AF1